MRLRLGLVSETTDKFLNQVKLCLFSLRKNGGALKNVPVTLITNSEPLDINEKRFFKKHFSPIEFKTMPRLGAIPHTSKLNVFYAIDPSTYDVLIFMDCDTVVKESLDHMMDPIKNDGAQFVCRRGGKTDRNRFLNFNALVAKFCKQNCKNKISFNGGKEWPMFNTGVFLATSEAVRKIRRDSIQFTYNLFNRWQKVNAIESLPFIKYFYRLKLLKTRQEVWENWTIEQGAIALSCINSGINVQYLDEIFNSWGGDINFRILHCFRSLYKFDRSKMYSKNSQHWIKEYLKSEIPGKVFLAKSVSEFIKKFPELT